MATKVAAVVGVGGGLGSSVARKFAKEGYSIALLARSQESLQPVKSAITEAGGHAIAVPCDLSKPSDIENAFKHLASELGQQPEVMVYNGGSSSTSWPPPGILQLELPSWQLALDVSVNGALLCSQQVLPSMVKAKRGTIIFTGATGAIRGGKSFAQLAVPKFALRGLSQSMAREFQPQGVHAAHVIVDGIIKGPRTAGYGKAEDEMLSPDAIGDTYWALHTQDKSCWTQELDVRPFSEKW